MNSNVIEVQNLVKYFPVRTGVIMGRTIGNVKAVDGISFGVSQGETFALVGESGCGKTTVANLILKLLDPSSGDILFQGKSLSGASGSEISRYRKSVQAVLQDPYGALNPRMRVGHIIGEPLEVHGYGRSERKRLVKDALRSVGLPESSESQFPHEFSGGQRQRIGVARALTLEPALIVLDEPVSNLDVSIRSQVLNLLKDIQEQRGISFILISHDLASVEHMSHRIGVMYLGKLVELGSAEQICDDPGHPYSASLVAASTPPNRTPPWQIPIMGEVPSAMETPSGCAFHPRCVYAMSTCREVTPSLTQLPDGRMVACHLYPGRIDNIDKHVVLPAIDFSAPAVENSGTEVGLAE